jgi:AcrR family transcriptional regulator
VGRAVLPVRFSLILRCSLYLWYKGYMNEAARQVRETSRDRRARETRSALLEAAYEVFCEQGFAASSLDAIAARAGFTRGALYKNFASKDELFLELAETRADSMFDEWRAVNPEDTADNGGRAVGSWLAEAIRNQGAWFLANAEFTLATARNPELAERHRMAFKQANRELGALLRRFGGQEDRFGGQEDDDDAIGLMAMALVDGLILQAMIDPNLDVAGHLATGLERLVQGA